jgi:protein-tyrosine phosphatase
MKPYSVPYSVLMVCMGNICRSPTAQGLQATLAVDSADTHNYHPGSPPDPRSQAHARKRGYDLSDLRARQIEEADFERNDLILVMDWDNLALTEALCPPQHRRRVRRLTEFCLVQDKPVVPDPYYGGTDGFEEVLDLVEDACDGLLGQIQGRRLR